MTSLLFHRQLVFVLLVSLLLLSFSSCSSSRHYYFHPLFVTAQTTTPPPGPTPKHIGLDNTTRMILYTASYISVSLPTLYFAPTAAFSVMRGVRMDLFLCRGGVRPDDEVGIGFFPSTLAPTLEIGDASKPGAETRGAIVIYLACVGIAFLVAVLKPKWSKETGREDWTIPPQLQKQLDDLHRQRIRGFEEELEREIEKIRARRANSILDQTGGKKKSKKKGGASDHQINLLQDAQMNREIQRARDRLINNNPIVQNPPEIPSTLPNIPGKPRPLLSYIGLVYAQFLCPWAMCAGFLFGVNETVGQALSVIPFIVVLLFFLIYLFRLIKLTETPSSKSLRVAPTIIVRPKPIEESTEDTLRIERLLKSSLGQYCLLPEASWEVPVAAQNDTVSFWNNSKILFKPFWGPFETCAAILNPSGGPVITDTVRRIFSRHFFTISAGAAIAICIMQGHGAVDRAFCRDYGRLTVMAVNIAYCLVFLLLRPYLLPLHNIVLGTVEVLIAFSSIVAVVGIPDIDHDFITDGSSSTFMILEIVVAGVSIIGGFLILILGCLSVWYLDKSKLILQHPTKRHMQMSRETSMSFLSVDSLGAMMDEEMMSSSSSSKQNRQNNNNNNPNLDDYLQEDLLGSPPVPASKKRGSSGGGKRRKHQSGQEEAEEYFNNDNYSPPKEIVTNFSSSLPQPSEEMENFFSPLSSNKSEKTRKKNNSRSSSVISNTKSVDNEHKPSSIATDYAHISSPSSPSRRVHFPSEVIEKDEQDSLLKKTNSSNNNSRKRKQRGKGKENNINNSNNSGEENKQLVASPQKWVNPNSKLVARTHPTSFTQQFEETLRPVDLLEELKSQARKAGMDESMVHSFGVKQLEILQKQREGHKKLNRLDEPQNVNELTEDLKKLLLGGSTDHGRTPSVINIHHSPHRQLLQDENYYDRDSTALLVDDSFQTQKLRLRAFYDHFAPHKTNEDIERALTAWNGQYDEMWEELRSMYGPTKEEIFSAVGISAPPVPVHSSSQQQQLSTSNSSDINNNNNNNEDVEDSQQLRSRISILEQELHRMRNQSGPWKQWRNKPIGGGENNEQETRHSSLDWLLASRNALSNNDSVFSSATPAESRSTTPQTATMNGLSMSQIIMSSDNNNNNINNNKEEQQQQQFSTPQGRGTSLSLSPKTSSTPSASPAGRFASNGNDERDNNNNRRTSFSLDSVVSKESSNNDDDDDDTEFDIMKYLRSSEENNNNDENDSNNIDEYFAAPSSSGKNRFTVLDDDEEPKSVSSPVFVIPDYSEFEAEAAQQKQKQASTSSPRHQGGAGTSFVLDEDESEEIDYNLPAKALRTLRDSFSWSASSPSSSNGSYFYHDGNQPQQQQQQQQQSASSRHQYSPSFF